METIKCKECGQVMGAMSESCPKCGAPVINEVETVEVVEQTERKISSIEEANTMDEVEEYLTSDNFRYYVPPKNLSQVLSMIEKYNKKAGEWGYETLAYDEQEKTLKGTFTEKSGARGFLASSKEAYRNGYLKGDFEKITKLCTI